eukprot:gene910-biopygen9359
MKLYDNETGVPRLFIITIPPFATLELRQHHRHHHQLAEEALVVHMKHLKDRDVNIGMPQPLTLTLFPAAAQRYRVQ